jgi:hypothetical protein
MAKCSKAEVRRLRTALRWKIPAAQRQRIQMVLLRESGMAQPAIAAAMGVSLSTVNRAHMAYDHGGIKALKPKPKGGRKHENLTLAEEKALLARFAAVASLIETCKLNGVDPQAYIEDVLTKLVNLWPASRIDDLMPWAWARAQNSTERIAA